MSVSAVVLAAGQGTRMKSTTPKVLHEIAGRPMLHWVVDALISEEIDEIVVVVGHEAKAVTAALPDGVEATVQEEQLGTGHATEVGMAALDVADEGTVVVVPGDTPLLHPATVEALIDKHLSVHAIATLLTTEIADPSGYGRILRDAWGNVTGVVEHLDADGEQRLIKEVATSIYAFAAGPLRAALGRVGSHNVQGERYLPDVIALFSADGNGLASVSAPPDEVAGVNTYDQLAEAAAVMRRRINTGWQREGVWMLDPERVYIDSSVVLSEGTRIYPGTHLEGATTVGAGAGVGPDVHVRDSRIGEDAVVRYSVLDGAEVQARASVGPFAYLRPGAVVGAEAKAGTFVELKNTTVGDRSKVPHLSYLGDATIGEDSNIGAGTITCNWDGFTKNPTTIGDRAFIGSDTMLVAPVEIGDDGWTGAGSTITHDVPPGSLAVERSQQREVPGYAERKRHRAREQGEE